ncbi:MAG: TetR/AcrR family transcriptional regulator, partial [Acidobacteria bacterium]
MLDLVTEVGLAGLTTRRIAERVGFTEGAIYRHFPTKSALVLALIDRLDEMLLGPVAEIAADATLPPRERIERILRHHAGLILARESLPIMLLAEAASSGDPALIERMRSVFGRYVRHVAEVLDEAPGDASGRRISADALASLLVGGLAGLAIHHRLFRDPEFDSRFVGEAIPFVARCS